MNFHNIHKYKMCRLFMNYIDSKEQHMLSKYSRLNITKYCILNIQQPNYMLCKAIYIEYMYFPINNTRLNNLRILIMNCIDSKVIRNEYIRYYLSNIYCHMKYKYLMRNMLSKQKNICYKYLCLNKIHLNMIYKHWNWNNHHMVVCRQCKFLN